MAGSLRLWLFIIQLVLTWFMKFTDPDSDFDAAYLEQIEAKQVEEYSLHDWMNIFQHPCPLGTFEETSALVPFALDLIERRQEGCSQVFSSFLRWTTGWESALVSSGMMAEISRRIVEILSECLSGYTIVQKMHSAYPKDGDLVFDVFRMAADASWMRKLIASIGLWHCRPDTFAKAAWIIEVECLMREGLLKDYNPFQSEDARQSIVECAYDVVLHAVFTHDDEKTSRYLIDKIQSNYIGA